MSDSTDHLDTLPRRLEHARRAAGLNRSALATKAGLNPSHVRLIEEGKREDPTGTTLARLADALGVSLDWLVRGIGDAPEILDECVEVLHDVEATPARGAA